MVSGQAEPQHGPAIFLGEPQHGPALFLGELGLDGALRHANGILPMVILARERQIGTVYVPVEDGREAAPVEGVQVIPVESLAALVSHPRDEAPIAPAVNRDGWDAVVPTDLARVPQARAASKMSAPQSQDNLAP